MIEKMKVVHIVAAASEKTALLDRLRTLGIVHFAEKASADQRHLERFAELSRMEMLLQEYTGQEPEKKLLSDKEFEVFYKDLAACIDRHKALPGAKDRRPCGCGAAVRMGSLLPGGAAVAGGPGPGYPHLPHGQKDCGRPGGGPGRACDPAGPGGKDAHPGLHRGPCPPRIPSPSSPSPKRAWRS